MADGGLKPDGSEVVNTITGVRVAVKMAVSPITVTVALWLSTGATTGTLIEEHDVVFSGGVGSEVVQTVDFADLVMTKGQGYYVSACQISRSGYSNYSMVAGTYEFGPQGQLGIVALLPEGGPGWHYYRISFVLGATSAFPANASGTTGGDPFEPVITSS